MKPTSMSLLLVLLLLLLLMGDGDGGGSAWTARMNPATAVVSGSEKAKGPAYTSLHGVAIRLRYEASVVTCLCAYMARCACVVCACGAHDVVEAAAVSIN